jgi:hypothetical protein
MSTKTKKETKKILAVQVLRWDDGTLYSQVVDKTKDHWKTHSDRVVIDRQRGRGLDSETVKRRAKAMAELLQLPYEEDFTWPCVAYQKRPCRCPQCIQRGNA